MAPDTRTASASTLTLPSDLELRLERTFAASRERVFRAWTDPQLVPRWMGSAAHPMDSAHVDLRAGGSYAWVWKMPQGESRLQGHILDVQAPHRLVAIETMPGAPWGETLNLFLFTERDGVTTVVVHTVFRDMEGRDLALSCGAQSGWDQGFARLDTLVGSDE